MEWGVLVAKTGALVAKVQTSHADTLPFHAAPPLTIYPTTYPIYETVCNCITAFWMNGSAFNPISERTPTRFFYV
jgi:hypothetical protein